jgi:hypothetical protein
MLGVGPEVVEGPKRYINSLFIEVCGFSHTQSCTWCIVQIEGCVGLHTLCTMRVPPLVNLRISIFDPIV